MVLCATFALLTAFLAVSAAPALAAAPESPETAAATEVTNTTALLHATINPKAQAAVAWFFRYREGSECTGAGGSATRPEPEEGVSEVEAAQPVKATLVGLKPGTLYTFCPAVRNEAEEVTEGKPESFTTTAVAPTVAEESFFNVTSTEATLSAKIDAGGVATTLKVEYGIAEPFGSSAEATLPAAEGPVGVLAHLTGLQPETLYHFRFVAHNALGTAPGEDATFETPAATGTSALTLPDSRAYELLSPVHGEDNSEVYRLPPSDAQLLLSYLISRQVFRASTDGNAMAYGGDPPASGGNGAQGNGLGNQWLAVRTAQGWRASDVTPTGSSLQSRYQAFSSDLTVGILRAQNQPANNLPPLTEDAPLNCNVLYSRTDSGYRTLFGATETPGFCGFNIEFGGGNAGTATIPRYSHLLFASEAALVEPAVATEEASQEFNLYESIGGRARLVNILPGGEPDPNAMFGGPSPDSYGAGAHESDEEKQPNLSNAVSADGSRVFWTDLKTGNLYVRENGTTTVPVSAGAEAANFWTATPDGKYVFYTEGEKLYRFDASTHTRVQLAGSGAAVKGVIGINETGEDGAYVYFVAGGVLATNENVNKEKAQAGECRTDRSGFRGKPVQEEEEGRIPAGRGCNLYVLHGGASTFVAALSAQDNAFPRTGAFPYGDWQASLGNRSAEVTPDGRHLAFMAREPLTGYENRLELKKLAPGALQAAFQTFVYDAESGRISCASCNPTGAPPSESTGYPEAGTVDPGASEPVPSGTELEAVAYMHRWINDAGTEVFFTTPQALVPQDTNGREDAYEWEQEGAGPSCPRALRPMANGGCIFLLSGGTSTDQSAFVDASANGSDVFFTTRAALVPQDLNLNVDMYDARVNGGFSGVSLACTGTGCQGVPPAPPLFATPPSVTFSGVGNFQTPAGASTKPRTAAQIREQKLANALKACRTKHNKNKRATCERQAHKRYRPTKSKAHKASYTTTTRKGRK